MGYGSIGFDGRSDRLQGSDTFDLSRSRLTETVFGWFSLSSHGSFGVECLSITHCISMIWAKIIWY